MRAMFRSANTSEGGGISAQPERHLSGQNEINIPNEAFGVRGREQLELCQLDTYSYSGNKNSLLSMILDMNPYIMIKHTRQTGL